MRSKLTVGSLFSGPGGRFARSSQPDASPVTWSPRSAALRDVVAIEYLDGSRELIGQTPRERPRPDAPPERPSGATVEKGRLAVMKCDECGNELEYTWMHVGRHSYHVGRCARCAPPLTIE